MKTKLLALILAFCVAACALCACRNEQAITQNSATTAYTTKYTGYVSPAYPIINTRSIEDLLATWETSEALIVPTIQAAGYLYYPDILDKSYNILSISSATATRIEFNFDMHDDNGNIDAENIPFTGSFFVLTIDYKERSLSEIIRYYENMESYECTVLPNGSVHVSSDGIHQIFFAYGKYVYELLIEGTELDWTKYFEIKSIDVNQ